MMRSLTILCALVVLVALPAAAQWQFMGLFPPAGVSAGDTLENGNMHGITVTPDNRVWMHNYGNYSRDSILVPDYLVRNKANTADSVLISRYIAVRSLHVYNPDGTPAPFSPIMVVNIGAGKDTIGFWRVKTTLGIAYSPTGSPNTNRGMRYDNNGHVLATVFGQVYQIDYTDGVTAKKVVVDSANSGVAVGADASGNFFAHNVVANNKPIKIYDNTMAYVGNVTDSINRPYVTGSDAYSRTVLASKDGNDVYLASYTQSRLLRYHSDNGVFGPYAVADTLLKGFACESMEWNPRTGYLWASAGSYLTPANAYPGTTTSYTTGAHYAYDVVSKTIKDSLIWTFAKPASANERARGIAFSTGGDTAYVVVFGDGAVPGVRRYKKVVTAVETIDNSVPSGYTLEQNFPNPFNPTTEIRFTMASEGVATVVIYDMLGREVGVLLHEFVPAGTYKTTFNAEGLTSGTYLYRLYANGTTLTKKMTLVK